MIIRGRQVDAKLRYKAKKVKIVFFDIDDTLRANDEHDFFFDINKIYLFDKKSGKSIIERRS